MRLQAVVEPSYFTCGSRISAAFHVATNFVRAPAATAGKRPVVGVGRPVATRAPTPSKHRRVHCLSIRLRHTPMRAPLPACSGLSRGDICLTGNRVAAAGAKLVPSPLLRRETALLVLLYKGLLSCMRRDATQAP